jgi:hypothetical protein
MNFETIPNLLFLGRKSLSLLLTTNSKLYEMVQNLIV